jgi:hypothetical protein
MQKNFDTYGLNLRERFVNQNLQMGPPRNLHLQQQGNYHNGPYNDLYSNRPNQDYNNRGDYNNRNENKNNRGDFNREKLIGDGKGDSFREDHGSRGRGNRSFEGNLLFLRSIVLF